MHSPDIKHIEINADELASALLVLSCSRQVAMLDSCGTGHLGSHLMLAGVEPFRVKKFMTGGSDPALRYLDEIQYGDFPTFATLGYELGAELNSIEHHSSAEPLLYAASFRSLIVFDYDSGQCSIIGDRAANAYTAKAIRKARDIEFPAASSQIASDVRMSFSHKEYLAAVDAILERIRNGDTYQTNLTQSFTAQLSGDNAAQQAFAKIRREHPAPFAAFITRGGSTVISASPERFFTVDHKGCIKTSPIKGTRPRGIDAANDLKLKNELETSEKDRAENTMIVDLLRNDLGRVCRYGSVRVEKLCDIEQHPSLFHLVSTVTGGLRDDVRLSDIIRALLPCGSITGAPKTSTMRIIDDIEASPRGISMGAIGYILPEPFSKADGLTSAIDMSVAIRTMSVTCNTAEFRVGGGIVIDSSPEAEWLEMLTKSTVLFNAVGISRDDLA